MIFSEALDFIGLIDEFSSLQWTRRYSVGGEFELHCSLTPANLALLARGNIIWRKDDVEAGFIEYRQMDQDNTGAETLTIKGKFISAYLNRRIIWGEELLNSTAENAIRTLITKHSISPLDADRIIPNLILGATGGFLQAVNYQTSYASLLDEVENLCALSELGYRCRLDAANKKLIFEVYEGLDRTQGQSINQRAIFSKRFENVLSQSYTDSLNNYRNTVLVGGMGIGAARKLVTITSTTGLQRFELWDDAKDLTNVVNEVTLTDPEYTATLLDRGNSKLAETKEIQTFDSVVNLNSNLVYKESFDLGDMVCCTSKDWGLTINSRITEIKEVYEEKGKSINITFGNNIPTLLSIIKAKLK